MSDDPMLRDHQKAWHGFTRLMLWGSIGVAVVLALMGIFLVD